MTGDAQRNAARDGGTGPSGAAEPGPKQTICHDILGRNKANRSAPAAPGQFRLGPPRPCSPEPLVFTPYALDVQNRAVFEVGMPRVPAATPRAFFYLDQLEEAVAARRVPIETYAARKSATPAPRRVLIFGIGRTGSTLVSKILAAAGIASISEPDILLNLSQRRMMETLDLLDPAPWNRLYLACLDALEAAHGPAATLAIKFRAQSSNRFHIRRLRDLLPDAHFIFLFRGVEDWARSFTGKFDFQAETLKWLLTENLHAAEFLMNSGADLRILRYEDFVRDPQIVLDGLVEPADMVSVRPALAQVMQADSQDGMFDIARPDSADAELSAFMEWWATARPSAQLDQLGLAL